MQYDIGLVEHLLTSRGDDPDRNCRLLDCFNLHENTIGRGGVRIDAGNPEALRVQATLANDWNRCDAQDRAEYRPEHADDRCRPCVDAMDSDKPFACPARLGCPGRTSICSLKNRSMRADDRSGIEIAEGDVVQIDILRVCLACPVLATIACLHD